MPRSLADNIRQRRTDKNMTRYALAKEALISQSYLTAIECGVKNNPSHQVLRRLATALGCTIDEIVPDEQGIA